MVAEVCALGARKSPLRRRCRAPNIVFLALAMAIASLLPLSSRAQTPTPALGSAASAGNVANAGNTVTTGSTANSGTTASPGSYLLQPTLGGNPATPPRFRRPGASRPLAADQPPPDKFAAPTRIGATPVYGSPNGLGAGNTGYDSMNTPRTKKKKKLPPAPAAGALVPQAPETTFTPVPTFNPAVSNLPPVQATPPPPVIYPKTAAIRPGASLPPLPSELPVTNPPPEVHPLAAAKRPGAIAPVPPLEYYNYSVSALPPTLPLPNTFILGALPQRLLPILAEKDPYAALGIRAGSFLLLPSIDLSGGYSTNPERAPGNPPSAYGVITPELRVASDWSNHSLTADIVGAYTRYANGQLLPSLNVPFLNAKVDGRVDVTRDTQLNLEVRYLINTDNPGSPNLPAQLARLPLNFDLGDTIGVAQQIGRLSVSFKGTFDRATYNPSQLTDGSTSSNDDRNFDQYAGIGRIGYEIDPGLKPFVEVQADRRIHDQEFDINGFDRDSKGASVSVGSAFNLFGSLTGEMALGYVERQYQDAALENINGVIANGALLWQPTALTTVRLGAVSQIYETTLAGASGEFSRDVNIEVDHAFRYWLIGILKAGYGNDQYVGSTLSDNRYFVSVGGVYKLTREMQMSAQVRQDWQLATQATNSYMATTFLLGLHLQR
jgi:hypothetical protein